MLQIQDLLQKDHGAWRGAPQQAGAVAGQLALLLPVVVEVDALRPDEEAEHAVEHIEHLPAADSPLMHASRTPTKAHNAAL